MDSVLYPSHLSLAPLESAGRPASRLYHYCGGLMEGCWLAAVVAIPLAYDPHAEQGFQPFKMGLLRLLAFVLVAAWGVRAIEGTAGKGTLSFDFAAEQGEPTVTLRVKKGGLHRNIGQLQEALAEFRLATEEKRVPRHLEAEAMLAHTLCDLGNRNAALPHALRAIGGAPPDAQSAVAQLKRQIQTR